MAMPKPDANHARVQSLAGTWIGEEHMPPSRWVPEGTIATARIENRVTAGGFVLAQDYEQRQGDVLTFAGHGVFWVDRDSGEQRLHWWDSTGIAPNEFRGSWDGDRLVLRSRGAMGHSRTTWVIGDDAYTHRMEMSKDAETWTLLMEGSYRRVE